MWKYPENKFNLGLKSKANLVKIDVTKSTPHSTITVHPQTPLKSILRTLTKNLDKSKSKILDLGAGRLGKTIHLLEEGYEVYATEFRQVFRTEKALKLREKAEKYIALGKFHDLILPEGLIQCNNNFFDLIVIINVPPIMPVPFERILLLNIARTKLKEDGYLLWVSNPLIKNHNYDRYRNKYKRRFSDGYLVGKKKNVEQFYTEILEADVETYLVLSGFIIDRNLSPVLQDFSSKNVIYCAKPQILNSYTVSDKFEQKVINGVQNSQGEYEIQRFPSLIKLLTKEIENTPVNKLVSTNYKHLTTCIIRYLFEEQIADIEVEKEEDQCLQLNFKCKKKLGGFLADLNNDYHFIDFNFVIIESRNEIIDENYDFNGILNRFSDLMGNFGILFYRSLKKTSIVINKCREFTHFKKQFILILNDKDIVEILNLYSETRSAKNIVMGLAPVNRFLHTKFKEILKPISKASIRTDINNIHLFIKNLENISLNDYNIIGNYRRYEKRERDEIINFYERIIYDLKTEDIFKSFLIWAAPGTGKTFLIEEIAKKIEVQFIYLNLTQDEGRELLTELIQKTEIDKNTLIFFDEIDTVKDYTNVLGIVEKFKDILTIFAGSSEGNMVNFVERMKAIHKG